MIDRLHWVRHTELSLVLGDGDAVGRLGVRAQPGLGCVQAADLALHQHVVGDVVADEVAVLVPVLDALDVAGVVAVGLDIGGK